MKSKYVIAAVLVHLTCTSELAISFSACNRLLWCSQASKISLPALKKKKKTTQKKNEQENPLKLKKNPRKPKKKTPPKICQVLAKSPDGEDSVLNQ